MSNLTITGGRSALNSFQIVGFAEHPIVQEGKLLTGGQLSAAGITGEAG